MRLKRTHYCGSIDGSTVGQQLVFSGWVDRWRDHGGVVFIDLRDRTGIIQIVFDPRSTNIPLAGSLRQEYVISVKGIVRARPAGMENKNIPTGAVELLVAELEILNRSHTLPYSLHDATASSGETDESLRLTHRYLELRRPELQNNLKIRHEFLKSARDYYYENGFWEIETPILYKTTPEGARDYLVPSRVHAGHFYALPQSPQTFKQLCMIGGMDRYVQIARCFRDEDLRADRQPEFTQIDVEMSFVDESDIMLIHEGLMRNIFRDVLNIEITTPFPRLRYDDVMRDFGSDKPDIRISLKLTDLSAEAKQCGFQVYRDAVERGGILKALCFEEKETLSRSELDGLIKKVAPFGAKGISWIRVKSPGDWQSPQAKFFDETLKAAIESRLPYCSSAMVFLVCGPAPIVNNALSYLRTEYGERFGYKRSDPFSFLWVTDFPLLEFKAEEGRFYAAHHPFTRPHPDDLATFMQGGGISELKTVRACAYDLVLNGLEIGGGSLRIYDQGVQSRMFTVLGITPEEAQQRFGFFLRALQYGTPPHGGIALGVDRIAMILAGAQAIRDVIAFPKTQRATCLMTESPSPVDLKRLDELSIRILQTP